MLEKVLTALEVPRLDANRIREACGFSPKSQPGDGFWFTLHELREEIETYDWPVFIVFGGMEILLANQSAQRVWNVDLTREFVEPDARSLIAVAADARFAERVENWLELVTFILGHAKGSGWSDLADPPPYFAEGIRRFAEGNERYLAGLINAWTNAVPLPPRFRYRYRVHWRDPQAGVMRFRCVLTTASLADELAWNEWVPADAESWVVLEVLTSGKRGTP